MSKKTHLGRRRFLKESVFGLFSASIATKGVWARIRESTRADSRETKDKSQPKINQSLSYSRPHRIQSLGSFDWLCL
jgi:hypothetical protein